MQGDGQERATGRGGRGGEHDAIAIGHGQRVVCDGRVLGQVAQRECAALSSDELHAGAGKIAGAQGRGALSAEATDGVCQAGCEELVAR